MTKTISAPLRTHLDLTVTTLATIWRIIRVDGTNFYFTSHDRDLPFDDGDGLATYEARSGYNRTAVSNNVGLSVDNMDMEGVFDSAAIQEDELRAGLFDHAEIRVSMVNWDDLTQGALRMRRGHIGEVILTPQGLFRAELRGLTQQLSQNIVRSYQSECRVDLGSDACTIPIRPPVLGRNQAVLVGEVFRVATNTASGIAFGNTIINPSFENGVVASPVASIDGWTIVSGQWSLLSSASGLVADDGLLYLRGFSSLSGEVQQTMSIVDLGVDLAQVALGVVQASFSSRRAHSDPQDLGRVLVEFLDAANSPTGVLLDTGDEEISPEDTWVTRAASNVVVPVGTTKIRVRLLYTRTFGSTVQVAFDNMDLTMLDTTGVPTTQEIYENRVYRVTTAGTTTGTQPAYDTTIANPTTDGTAVLVADDSFTRHGTISTVADRLNLAIDVSEARAVDGWYNGGALIVETGPNAGAVREIKEWTQTGGVLSVFIAEPFNLTQATRIRLYPGCDKRLATCRDRFDNILNFRGEPFIPGQDALTSTPNAN